MVKITVNFFWKNQEVLSDSVELPGAIIGASALVQFFSEFWNIDVNDYTLRDILIDDANINVHLKSLEDFRQVRLSIIRPN
jgi:hypothetical protein